MSRTLLLLGVLLCILSHATADDTHATSNVNFTVPAGEVRIGRLCELAGRKCVPIPTATGCDFCEVFITTSLSTVAVGGAPDCNTEVANAAGNCAACTNVAGMVRLINFMGNGISIGAPLPPATTCVQEIASNFLDQAWDSSLAKLSGLNMGDCNNGSTSSKFTRTLVHEIIKVFCMEHPSPTPTPSLSPSPSTRPRRRRRRRKNRRRKHRRRHRRNRRHRNRRHRDWY